MVSMEIGKLLILPEPCSVRFNVDVQHSEKFYSILCHDLTRKIKLKSLKVDIIRIFIFPGRELIIEMFLYQQPYLNALQTMCPHVLRYLATAVVINKNSRRAAMKVKKQICVFLMCWIIRYQD